MQGQGDEGSGGYNVEWLKGPDVVLFVVAWQSLFEQYPYHFSHPLQCSLQVEIQG